MPQIWLTYAELNDLLKCGASEVHRVVADQKCSSVHAELWGKNSRGLLTITVPKKSVPVYWADDAWRRHRQPCTPQWRGVESSQLFCAGP
jgi:hypothetical protein